MYRTVQSIISSALLSLSLLPALTIAAESDTNTQTMQRGMMRGNQSTAFNPQEWRGEPGTPYSQQGWGGEPSTAYRQQGWGGEPGTAYRQQGWSTGSHYSYEQPIEVHGAPGNFDHQGVTAPAEQGYSYSPGFHRVRGGYNGSANHYPTYSNPSYGHPSDGYHQEGNYGNPNDRGMGAGNVYFNVR